MINLSYGKDSVPEDKETMIWKRVEETVETLIKTQEEGTDGKGKEIVHDEGVSSVRQEGSGGLGVGCRPVLGGRIPTLPTVVSMDHVKVRTQKEVDLYRALVGQ